MSIVPSRALPRSPRVELNVTQEIIATATKADSSHCMLADAVRKAYPGARNVSVDIQTIRFSDPDKGVRFIYLTPRKAQLALVDFDAGVPSEPFTVVLRGAHVATMRSSRKHRDVTPAGRAALAETVKSARQYSPTHAGVRTNQWGHEDSVERVGGVAPPMGALASGPTGRKSTRSGDIPTARRRSFGLRAMQMDRAPVNPAESADD